MTPSEVTPRQIPYATETGRESPRAPALEGAPAHRRRLFPLEEHPEGTGFTSRLECGSAGGTAGTSRRMARCLCCQPVMQ